MKTKNKIFSAIALALVSLASYSAQFGASLKTPRLEDVVIMDATTYMVAVGAEDGMAAAFINLAASNNQDRVGGGNKQPPSLTERLFNDVLPSPPVAGANKVQLKGSEIQNILLKRKQDVIGAKRFLFPMKLEAAIDFDSKNASGETLIQRDKMSRYVLHFQTDSKFWQKSSEGVVSFQYCFSAAESPFGDTWKSNRAQASDEHCLTIPAWTDLNLVAGIFVSDLSKFGDLGTSGAFNTRAGHSTLRVGIIVSPEGRSGTFRSYVGRDFAASAIVIWDMETMQVVAGPIPLDANKHSPDILYATNNCKKVSNGINPLVDPSGNCAQLNPTLPAVKFDVTF